MVQAPTSGSMCSGYLQHIQQDQELEFQHQLEKPQEIILFRLIHFGGLGLSNVNYKAFASLIRHLIETAIHPSFQHSLLFVYCMDLQNMPSKQTQT